MSAVYTIPMVDQTVVADETLIILRAATAVTSRASLLEVLRISVSQRGTATSQMLGILLGMKASAFGTYTSSPKTEVSRSHRCCWSKAAASIKTLSCPMNL